MNLENTEKKNPNNQNVQINSNDLCLISKEPIENKITLPCSHSFEYYYLYQEINQQVKRHRGYFKCPYCRHQYMKSTIPYYEIDDVEKINHINFNDNTLIPILKCHCGKPAHRFKIGNYCKKHHIQINRPKCNYICKNKNQCKLFAVDGTDYCKRHNEKN